VALATIAAPTGIMTALSKRMADAGVSSAQLYAATGLSASDWTALQTALSGANAAAFLKFSTALGVVFAMEPAGVSPMQDPQGSPIGKSLGPYFVTSYGDLT